MKKNKILILALSGFLMIINWHLMAQNPLITEPGMTDPHLKHYDGKFWLYTGHDTDPNSTTWIMPDWRIYSSENLRNWQLEGTIYPDQNYMGTSLKCAAGDAVYRNGYYYWYFTNATTDNDIGVMIADQPQGPFRDPLGKPLLSVESSPAMEHDPTIFVEDDEAETHYIVYGAGFKGGYYIARLNEDMISLSETPRLITVTGAFQKNDKNFLHKRNSIYYLTCGTDIATSDNVYGPYEYKGKVGDRWWLDGYAHGSFLEYNGQWFHVWTRYFNRDINKVRENLMTYTHYKDDGTMVDDVEYLDAHYYTGVGAYDASWEKIEAEWYMAISGAEKRESSEGGFEIQGCKSGTFLNYPNMQNFPENGNVSFRIASSSEMSIEIRENKITGNVIGICNVPNTGGLNKYETMSCRLKNTAGVKNIYLVFKGKETGIANFNWFKVERDKISGV